MAILIIITMLISGGLPPPPQVPESEERAPRLLAYTRSP